ncbi:MAG: NAD(P)/FAD-dependent oxidoreductase [Deltaproteobacteria bacterium]|nr:NAD(P)/FAD-dependent oxidoreductase [Deltaproteobacteria bacterium]
MKYDVCILGAGPAGLSAAFELQNSGARVILVERHTTPGSKACGGGLTADAMTAFSRMTADCASNDEALVSQLAFEPYQRLTVYSGGVGVPDFIHRLWCATAHTGNNDIGFLFSSRLRFRTAYMHVSSRVHWQSHLLKSLQNKGVRVLSGMRGIGFDRKSVVLSNGSSVHADFIVAADGSKSRCRRQLGLPSAVGAVCRQLRIPRSLAADAANAAPSVWFNHDLFGASYGWVFPYRHELRIGCGVPTELVHSAARLKSAFFSWLSHLNISWQQGKLEGGSIGSRYAGHRFGHIFLAGDAAGMASSVTGEGIGQAIISGAEVAREILQSNYRSSIIPALAIRHERTFGVLSQSRPGPALYRYAAPALRFPGVASLAIRKFS